MKRHMTDESPHSSNRQPLIMATLLVIATVIVFGQVGGHGFLNWDDTKHIRDNPHVNPPSWHGLAEIWTEPYWGLYIPLSYTFFAGEAAIAQRSTPDDDWSLSATVFHLGNLALHVGCVLVVFVILRRLFRHDGAACAGAMLFAVHPLQVESVAWISETRGVLCALFGLLAVWRYLCYADPPRPRKSTAAGYVTATAAFVAALLCKPAAVAVPLMIAALEFGLLRRPVRQIALSLGPWLLIAGVWVVLTKYQQPDRYLAFVAPPWTRPLVAGDALSFYLLKLIAPWHLGPDYGRSPAWTVEQWWFYFAWLLPAAVLLGLGWLKDRRLWLTAAGMFFVGLLPVLGLVPFSFQRISTVADRYVYLAMLGPALAFCGLLAGRWKRSTAGIAAIVLGVLGTAAFVQTSHWRDDESLLTHALRVNSRSLTARHSRGLMAARKQQHAEAIEWYRAALADHPDNARLLGSLGRSLIAEGQLDHGLRALREAVRLAPHSAVERCYLADALAGQNALAEAEESYRAAIQLDRKCTPAYVGLGKLLIDRQDLDGAIGLYRTARDESPRDVMVLVNLGAALEMLATPEAAKQAEDHYRAALKIRPDWAAAHFNLANLLEARQAPDEAVEHYRAALRFDPNYARAHVNLGIVLAQQGKAGEAIDHYRAALRIDRRLLEAYLNLGAALAAEGRAGEAAAEFRRGLKLVPPDSDLAERVREILGQLEDR